MSQSSTKASSGKADIANVDMAAAWDGLEGDHWTDNADRYEATSDEYGRLLIQGAAIAMTDDVLDIGCGTGRSTRQAARTAPEGTTLGVDLSGRMLDYARKVAAAEGLTNVRFEQADAQVHPLPPHSFDVVISLFGSMFFSDPVAAFANIARAVRPEGRLALLAWRDLPRNEWVAAIRTALTAGRDLPLPPPGVPGPFAFSDAAHPRAVLEEAGFTDITVEQADASIYYGKNAEDAFSFVATFGITRGLTQDLDDRRKTEALEALRQLLAAHDTAAGVSFGASAWLIRAKLAATS